MEKEVREDVSGYLKRILVSLITVKKNLTNLLKHNLTFFKLKANRSEAPADQSRARQLAQVIN